MPKGRGFCKICYHSSKLLQMERAMNATEKEIMPGVFMVDFRSNPSKLGLGLEETQLRIKELETSLKHLTYSNEEIMKAYEEDKDPIYVESHQENLVVIEKQKRQLQTLLDYLASQFPHTVPQQPKEDETDDGGIFV